MNIEARVQSITSQGRVNDVENFLVRLDPVDKSVGIKEVLFTIASGSIELSSFIPGSTVTVTVS